MLKTIATRLFILFILIAFSSFKSSEAQNIPIYWGQNAFEGNLSATCESGLYTTVNIAYLTTFGNGQKPSLNLGGHCNASNGSCAILSEQIQICQNLNISVFLSIGGAGGTYSLSSPDDAKEVANYLWINYLARNSTGPLGNVPLDGIDLGIIRPASSLYWDDLAGAILEFRKVKKFNLSASPRCLYPDPYLQVALRNRRFDSISVRFYNDLRCDYDGSGIDGVISAWSAFDTITPNTTRVYMGLPAAPEAADSGFIPPDVVIDYIFPLITKFKTYEGVTLWNRYYDLQTSYSSYIWPYAVSTDIKLKLPSQGVLESEH